MGWRWGWRRAVVAAGCTSVVLGYLGLIAAADLLPPDPSTTTVAVAVGLVALIPLGFVLMLEGLVTWPADGSPYPLRTRLRSVATVLTVGVVGVVCATLTHRGMAALVPRTPGASGATAAPAAMVGMQVSRMLWRRLRTPAAGAGAATSR